MLANAAGLPDNGILFQFVYLQRQSFSKQFPLQGGSKMVGQFEGECARHVAELTGG